jgi:glycosyltransferase involved in cell wall biosynthesis
VSGAARGGRKVAVAFHEPVIGGAAIAMLRVLPLLEGHGWRFVFWVPPGPLEDELRRRGYETAGEDRMLRYSRDALSVPPGAAARLRSVPGYLTRFRRWLAAESPDLVQANTLITIPEAMTARTTGTPVLMYVHEILPGDARGMVAGRLIRATAKVVVTNSARSLAALRARGVRAQMSHYGIQPPERPPDPPERERFVVGTLGTVSPRKGSDVFLEVARRVRERLPRAEFRMIGPCPEGSERPWAEGIVERARAEGVHWGTTDDSFREMNDWDLLLFPTRSEPFGLVVIEAMAMCRPVVASNVDGPAEILTEDSGLLVEVDDAGAMAAAVLELAADRERRLAMGHAGRRRVESEFTLEHQAERLHTAYLEALGSS